MTHAERIAAAQQSVLVATARRDVLDAEVKAAVPDPGHGCTTAMFNAWNDRLEAEMERSGYNDAAASLVAARTELYDAGAAWVRTVAPDSIVIDLLSRADAGHIAARYRLTDLWMRLDMITVKA